MGKPKGEGGRSKGRPSSSSVAVVFWCFQRGLWGYLGSSRIESSSIGEEAGTSSDVDGELAQHLKRLGRKDPITKVKALTTLSALFKQVSGSELAIIVPKWAFEYKKLLYDYSRDVRRSTHEAMANLVAAVRKGLAPHLKSLMGPWWFSQFDPVPEVAQAARRSLEAAFPAQEKRLDALVLCASDIFLYLDENLRLKPQEMMEKSIPTDELEEMHNHVISSSLLAVATLLDVLIGTKLQTDDSDTARKDGKIFSAHNFFLEFFKSKSPRVRSATYSILGSYVKHMPHVFSVENLTPLSTAILSAFREKDASCHSSMWDMVLLFSKKFPDSWFQDNVQKGSLASLWHFLRNGCYGSQQVSYPILILLLDAIPPKAIIKESFLLKFFQNLWAGRNPHFLLWINRPSLKHSRNTFFREDNIFHFQVTLIENIVVLLLWHEYIFIGRKDDPQVLHARSLETSSVNYPFSYFQELARCIIGVLSNISLRKISLLGTFCTPFQKDCLDILQQEENLQKYSEQTERISNFLLLLDQHALQKNETWPLNHDSSDVVNVLRTMVEIFGPRTIVSHLFTSSAHYRSVLSDEGDDKVITDVFLDLFKEDFVPLCLQKYTRSSSSRLDLLISLLDEEIFSEQWLVIMLHARMLEQYPGTDHVRVLAMLMEKLREKIGDRTPGSKLQRISINSECWQHDFLNSVAVSIACQRPPFSESDVSFLCAALGGSSEYDQACFLSGETVLLVFEEILKKLVGFLVVSPFKWVKSASSLLLAYETWDLIQKWEMPFTTTLEMAQFAFDILAGSIYCLKRLDNECGLIASILAAILIIGWEYNITSEAFVDDDEDVYLGHVGARLVLGKKMYEFRSRIGSSFLRSLTSSSRAKLEDALVLTVKSAISDTDRFTVDRTTTLCCKWVVGMLEDICRDGTAEQQLLTKLLSNDESWTFWVGPCSGDGGSVTIHSENPDNTHEFTHQSFSAFVSKLVLNLGVDKIIAGVASLTHSSLAEVPKDQSVSLSFSRSWLAAELLCSWKWHGGSILIDGAIIHATTGLATFLNPWILSDDEVENIQNPYLRALVSLLLTLTFKDSTWTEREANLLLDYTVDKLFVGTEVDLSCLKILPFILNVLIQPCGSSALDALTEDRVHGYVLSWLEKALSLPSLALNSVEWVQVVISCFPLCITRESRNIRVKALQDINHLERKSLLSLFRKQKCSLEINSATTAQMMLANLTAVAVGYCWLEFDEVDWDYVFSQLHLWTNSTVLVMEEAAENVDSIIVNAKPGDSSDSVSRKLEVAVQIIGPQPINITRTALIIFSLFSQLAEDEEMRTCEVLQSIKSKTWESIKNDLIEHTLRLFFSTGATEAIASSFGAETSSVIASNRLLYSQFWELVGFCAINSPDHVRTSAVQSMDLWGLSKGSVTALYAILFSSKPLSSLQFAAFHILSSEPVCRLSVLKESCLQDDTQSENVVGSSLDESICLRDEISCIIEKPAAEVLKTDLTSPLRVNIFLAWALLLSHLQSLPSSSLLKEKLIQCIQDSISPLILDLVFQQFPLKAGSLHSLKKKDAELPIETSKAANGAKHAITTCSLFFAIETFWPIDVDSMASLAGSIYGLMIRLLPAYVRNWFTALRDRSSSQSIESFTKLWCSPPLFSEELSQVSADKLYYSYQGAAFGDDNFSVTLNKSALEIIATYKKEESGMDLVIRLPGCYPLRPVDVDCTRSLGVSEVKQRKWLLSLTAFVCNQNGAIAEAIRTWKSNLDREFEGVEECPICYSIIHTTNHSLPRLACKTCKHKFHSACLYKWFSTSHKSTCPLCQTPSEVNVTAYTDASVEWDFDLRPMMTTHPSLLVSLFCSRSYSL
ncbi:unnamed protein product [Spirodela intermedia]|uniref:E3 ubiquitin-protein ligase listerin n=1 Tax=Spirodela intermedia TaxID=51605 RepID=A0A7I8JGL6_SPIIN|nr:unnamed protein product [Spirodela intermedia]CAA6669280.1 unnamed protein product [Spirodela intermedia]